MKVALRASNDCKKLREAFLGQEARVFSITSKSQWPSGKAFFSSAMTQTLIVRIAGLAHSCVPLRGRYFTRRQGSTRPIILCSATFCPHVSECRGGLARAVLERAREISG